jgi:heme/copper-type cytochrome/quinol oxidase subunit 2
MRLLWQARSNPLAWWWALLTLASSGNIALWFMLYCQSYTQPTAGLNGASGIELMLFLCAAYVFGCAFRSLLPRADVQRICLFDTWLSSVFIGRSVATVAEVCFAAQWAIVLHHLGRIAGVDTALNVAWAIVPLIVVAQCCSWYGVLTTNHLAHAIENSIWAVAFLVVVIGLCRLLPEFDGPVRLALVVTIVGMQPIWLFSLPSTSRCT